MCLFNFLTLVFLLCVIRRTSRRNWVGKVDIKGERAQTEAEPIYRIKI